MPGRFRFIHGEIRTETESGGQPTSTVTAEPVHERKVSDYEPKRIIRHGSGDYSFTRQKFGPLAASDVSRVFGSPRDSRFSVSSLSREPLSIAEEERRSFEERVRVQVDALAVEAFEAAKIEGRKQGEQEGRDAALQEARAAVQEKLDSLAAMLESAEAHRRRLLEQQERFFMELVMKIARKVCLKEVAADPAYVSRLLHALVEQSGARENLRIRISMQDAETIRLLRQELLERWADMKNLTIEPSAQVSPGGCELETDVSSFSASVASQLDVIEQALFSQGQSSASGAGA